MLIYEQGNLIKEFSEKRFDAILHQCNLTVGLGAGIAYHLANAFPGLREADEEFRKTAKMGDILVFNTPYGKIINLYSQFHPGQPLQEDDLYIDRVKSLQSCLEKVKELGFSSIGIPLIASGLAADQSLKRQGSDLHYFKHNIAWVFDNVFQQNIDVIYL